MKSWMVVAVVMILASFGAGCSSLQAIDQWKCDHLGCCMFGTRPSQVNHCPACEPACADPCAPTLAPIITGPVVTGPVISGPIVVQP